jgi:alkanesulfonate monooxygenase SsuD/methylene tetrahydromethanopterin reductase-like flavin-dependent oxidoreductase (luciferase family)
MIDLIDDDLCDQIALAGTKETVREKALAWATEAGADRLMCAGPWYGPKPERMFENYTALVETFGTSGGVRGA